MPELANLNALRALETAVRHGSFKGAAKELGVTAAAVGQQVRKLEETIGQQLLLRHANGFQPSEAAVLASAKLSEGFDSLREALTIIAPPDAGSRLFLTVTPTIGERWLAPRLSKFLSANPAIDLRIDSTPYVVYRASSEFDFALRYDRPGASGRPETRLFGEVLIPVCTPEAAKSIGPVNRPDCLLNAPLIHVDRSTDDPAWLHWEEWGQKFGYEIPLKQTGIHANLTPLALHALFDGHGLHLAQLSITLPDLQSGRLVAPFGVSCCVTPGYPYSLVRLGLGPETQLHRDFRNWVMEEGAETQASMDDYLRFHI